jgi:hypothetical protein
MSTIILLLALVCNAAILVIPLAGTNEPNGTLDAGVLSRISCAVEIVKASKDSRVYPRRVVASGGFSPAVKLGLIPKVTSAKPKPPKTSSPPKTQAPKTPGYTTHAAIVSAALRGEGLPNEALLPNRILGKSMEEEAVLTQQLVRGNSGKRIFGETPSVIVVASEDQADRANVLFGYSFSNCTGMAIQYNVSVCTNGHVAATLKRPKISEQQEAMNLIKPFLGNRSSSTWLRFVNQHLFCNGSKVTYTPNKKTLAKTLTDLVQRKELERLLRKPHLYWYVLEFCGLVFVLCLTVSCAVQIAKGWPEQWDETTLPYNIWKMMSHRRVPTAEEEGDRGYSITVVEEGDPGHSIGRMEGDDNFASFDKEEE